MEPKKTILIVEDDFTICNILKNKLEIHGFNVFTAENGEKGLLVFEEQQPHLIVLDLVMPVMNGFVMFEKLKENNHLETTKIIVFSNMPDTGKLPVCSSSSKGIYEYIVKTDIKMDDFVAKIKEILS